jgi:S-formylglutathione hydrolase
MSIKLISENKAFGGYHRRYSHSSKVLNCTMTFAVFIPNNTTKANVYPALYWLSGLTCTDENFMQKSGAMNVAQQLGIILIAADTSPRGENIPDDPEKAYDFGLGAGFYVNATQDPWKKNYQMYDYIVHELPKVITELNLPIQANKVSIAGHSMGGHGALVIAMRNSEKYKSVSAFSPICNPCASAWGKKAFTNYLGDNTETWKQYDACELITNNLATKLPVLIDQGDKDEFFPKQLRTETLSEIAQANNYPLTINMRSGYDHSYYFIASFIEQHLQFHWQFLQ